MEIITEIVGWIGTLLIVSAYFLVSNKKVEATSNVYQIMNLVGAIGVGINVFNQQAWPALALEVVWGIIAISILWNRRR